jgi:serine/threonine-protein kinase
MTTDSIPLSIRVPGFRLRRQVGSDSIGFWFDAEQENLGRKLTVKVLKPMLEGKEAARRAFLSEMDRLISLDHPNVLQVVDAKRGDPLALITERIGGKTLADLLEPGKPLGQQPSLLYARGIANALAYLLSKGLACKNVSPVLLQLLGDTDCRLITFRSVIALEEFAGLKGRLTQDARYVAPEQLAGKYAIGPRTASYHVATLLFHMLAGLPPHVAPTPVEVAKAHVQKAFPHLKRLQPFLPQGIYELIASCTERNPSERPTLPELVEWIEELVERGPKGSGPRLRRKRWRRRR